MTGPTLSVQGRRHVPPLELTPHPKSRSTCRPYNERRIEMRPLLSSPNGLLVATESQESIRLTSPVNGSEAGFLKCRQNTLSRKWRQTRNARRKHRSSAASIVAWKIFYAASVGVSACRTALIPGDLPSAFYFLPVANRSENPDHP